VKGKNSNGRKKLQCEEENLTRSSLHEDMETEFLQSVLSYKKNLEENRKIKIVDKLGNPRHFRPVDKITNKNIDKAWIQLYDYMYERGIYFYVRNPNIRSRELYRFVTEELFELEVENTDKTGTMDCFIYDEFYPDYKYENQKVAVDECIMHFFEKKDLFDFYFSDSIKFNRYKDVSKKELFKMITFFRTTYDAVKNLQVIVKNCNLKGYTCKVTGSYKANFIVAGDEKIKAGRWIVEFIFDRLTECWNICNVQIKGLVFYLPVARTEQ